jgi:hypothetical protein
MEINARVQIRCGMRVRVPGRHVDGVVTLVDGVSFVVEGATNSCLIYLHEIKQAHVVYDPEQAVPVLSIVLFM